MCPLCGTARRQHWLWALGFELVQCATCGHRYATEVLAREALGEGYYNEEQADLAARTDTPKSRRFGEYLDLIPELRKPGRVLDVGCNAGELLAIFRDHGWQVEGVEISPGPAAFARRQLNAPVFNGAIEDFTLSGEPFDLITLSHVLEHLHEPRAVLTKLSSLVATDGGLLVEVPNADDLALPAFGGLYRPLCPGDHVSFFDRNSLEFVLALSGWRTASMNSPLHARDVIYASLLSSVDALRTRGGRTLGNGDGVASQVRYRGRLRKAIKAALDVIVEAADPLVAYPQRRLAPRRGAVLIAYARPATPRG